MLPASLVIGVSFAYLFLLFAVASCGDRRAAAGRSVIGSAWVYALSIAVYCTAWTFYGAVGYAVRSGLEFVTIYLGPTLVFVGWWLFLRKLVRVARIHRVTSIADMISFPWTASWELQGIDMGEFKYCKRWFDEMSARPAVQRGMAIVADPGEDPKSITPEEQERRRGLLYNQRARPAPAV